MPRLSLRLPAELGGARGEASGRGAEDARERGRPRRRDSATDGGRHPRIVRWLECWADSEN
jgi:hypothetical protein